MDNKYLKVNYSQIMPAYYSDFFSFEYLMKIADCWTVMELIDDERREYRDLLTGEKVLFNIPAKELEKDILDIPFYIPFCFYKEKRKIKKADLDEVSILKNSNQDTKKIKFYLDLIKIHQLEMYYWTMLNNKDLDISQKREIEDKLKCLDELQKGKKYAIKYSYLFEPVVYLDNFGVIDNEFKDKYTIVEYLGDGLYKDLTSGFTFTISDYEFKCQKENGRVDYSKINEDDYELAIKYPLGIIDSAREFITDDILLDIINNTYPEKEKINSYLGRVSKIYQELYKENKDKIMEEEFSHQYEEAYFENKRRDRIKELEEVKKIYKLS